MIHVWGLFVALGIICGTALALQRAKSRGIKQYIIVDIIFWATFASLIGARGAFIIFNGNNATMGFSSIGAILAGFIAVLVVERNKKISLLGLLDIFGPALLLTEGVGRIGCFILHEHLGRTTSFILGLNIMGESRHDLGLYFSLVGFAGLFFVLTFERIWKKRMAGTIGMLSILWYFAWRFALEFLLESSGPLAVTKIYGLTFMQIFSGLIIIMVIGYYFIRFVVLRMLQRVQLG